MTKTFCLFDDLTREDGMNAYASRHKAFTGLQPGKTGTYIND
jgi:hypothetical protein